MSKRVLILCTGNSCRSQMAEGLWQKLGAGAWEARSAGSSPTGDVHPFAIDAMAEIGIDISANHSKHVDTFAGEPFDLVITVCDNAREACPTFPGAAQLLHWPFDDPATVEGTEAEKRAAFRRVRNEIKAAIRDYLRQ